MIKKESVKRAIVLFNNELVNQPTLSKLHRFNLGSVYTVNAAKRSDEEVWFQITSQGQMITNLQIALLKDSNGKWYTEVTNKKEGNWFANEKGVQEMSDYCITEHLETINGIRDILILKKRALEEEKQAVPV